MAKTAAKPARTAESVVRAAEPEGPSTSDPVTLKAVQAAVVAALEGYGFRPASGYAMADIATVAFQGPDSECVVAILHKRKT